MNTLIFETAQFVTLTYHENVTEWKRAYADFRKLLKRAFRKYPPLPLLWVREFQKRGAVHFHILIMDASAEVGRWFVDTWHEIVAPNDYHHTLYGGTSKEVDSPRKAVAYIAKYASKTVGEKCGGRSWGQYNTKHAPKIEAQLTITQAADLEAYMQEGGAYSMCVAGGNRSTVKYLGALGSATRAIEALREGCQGEIAYVVELC